MRYSAAYLLAILGGNPSPKVADIAKILGSVGIECNEKRAQQVVDACEGKSVEDIIAEGVTKIDSAYAGNTTASNPEIPIKSPQQTRTPRASSPSPPSSPLNSDDGDDDNFGSLFG